LQIALAYTLSAPFAVLASVGPLSPEELEGVVAVLSLPLTEQQRVFLERAA
jgi:aryl-alcohol dehydrogenase-like predicted oxidoreductase